MGFFKKTFDYCSGNTSLDWILERVRGIPSIEQLKAATNELEKIKNETVEAKDEVVDIIEDATAAAKQEIMADVGTLVEQCENAELSARQSMDEARSYKEDADDSAERASYYSVTAAQYSNEAKAAAETAAAEFNDTIEEKVATEFENGKEELKAAIVEEITGGGIVSDFPYKESADFPGCFYREIEMDNWGFSVEWLNPPMAVGVEYRLAERYNGEVVYTKRGIETTTIGTAFTNTEHEIYHDIFGIKRIIDYKLLFNQGVTGLFYPVPYMLEGNPLGIEWIGENSIKIGFMGGQTIVKVAEVDWCLKFIRNPTI